MASWESQGVKIRGRALVTTLFARMFLADLFIHGIGGAKYDQLTDQMIGRFLGCDAPEFMILTATMRLPSPADSTAIPSASSGCILKW